jgi:periplasmic divalent cation tolerance protein
MFIGYQGQVNDIRMVFCTFPNAELARQIGTSLIEKQLAACVNLVPGVESIYRWQGQVEIATEILAIFKTTNGVLPAFEAELMALHPYEVPEMVALDPALVAGPYHSWVLNNVTRPGR